MNKSLNFFTSYTSLFHHNGIFSGYLYLWQVWSDFDLDFSLTILIQPGRFVHYWIGDICHQTLNSCNEETKQDEEAKWNRNLKADDTQRKHVRLDHKLITFSLILLDAILYF